MDHTELINDLIRLDPFEELGRHYYKKYGAYLSHGQLTLLRGYSPTELPTPETIHGAEFESKRLSIESRYAAQYRQAGLSEQAFLPPDHNIEIEKLMRFIRIPSHRHTFLEMVYVVAGTCRHTVNGQTFVQQAGCFTIINAYTDHELTASADCLCLTIKVRRDTFAEFHIPNLTLFSVPISFDCGTDHFIQDMLLMIYIQQNKNSCYQDEIISLLLQTALTYCMQNFRDTLHFLHTGSRIEGKMLEIQNYIFENYQYITLRGLAQHFHYSEPYLCKLFHTYTNTTFSQLLREFRMQQAQKLLQTTSLKLDDLCATIGYSDTTQFIRDFKKQYGVTPARYRRGFLQNE